MSSASGPPGQQPQGGSWQQGPQPQYEGYTPPAPPQPPRSKKPWIIAAVAFGCVLVLLVVAGIGVGIWALSGDDEPDSGPSATDTSDPEEGTATVSGPSEDKPFKVIYPGDPPAGTAEEIREILGSSPLTTGTYPTIGSCELPKITKKATQEELQAFLSAGNTCLSGALATTMSDRNLSWTSPRVVVFTWPDIPADTPCEANTFDQTFPRMCNLDNVLYWPMSTEGLATDAAEEDLASAYLVDLAYLLMQPLSWQTSLGLYNAQASDQYEEGSAEWKDQYRRFNLQGRCMSAALAMQLPDGAKPSKGTLARMVDEKTWPPNEEPRDIPPRAMVQWIAAGRDSGGDLAACNTWTVSSGDISG